jgi:two-component sensor histidine kinase
VSGCSRRNRAGDRSKRQTATATPAKPGDLLSILELAKTYILPFVADYQPRVEMDGAPIVLNSAATQAFGLAFHELATNAIKYGALFNEKGRYSVAIAGRRIYFKLART